ncbi:MAG TPA: hypothetical protein P5092_03095 [Ruminococcus sp.]|nr:hypothetical protein [Ruminococcus sp.]
MFNIKDSKFTGYDYNDWFRYLKRNDRERLKIDFSSEHELTNREREIIFPSVRAFQRGEQSDGKCLVKAAVRFAKKYGEDKYPDVMKLFIREENFHSSYLAQYMNHFNEPLKKNNGLDHIFRKQRQSGGLFMEVSVLVTAEMIALSYYSALGNVARMIDSPALADICGQMLHDELPHIVLQSHTLGLLGTGPVKNAFRRFLMGAATIAVWIAYGDLLAQGGYWYKKFRSENFGYLAQSIEIADKTF